MLSPETVQRIGTRNDSHSSEPHPPEATELLSFESFLESWTHPRVQPIQLTKLLLAFREIPFCTPQEAQPSSISEQEPTSVTELQTHFETVYQDNKELSFALTAISESEITPTEYAVLLLLSQGNSNTEISQIQKTSYQTTRNHMTSILEKLSSFSDFPVENRTTATIIALETGILPEIIPLNFPQLFLNQTQEDSTQRFASLSDRENEVLTLVTQGLDSKKIALLLNVSDKTISKHLTNINLKLDCFDRTQAALCYLSAELLEEKVRSPYATRSETPESAGLLSLDSFLESWIKRNPILQLSHLNTALSQIPFEEEVSPSYLSMIENLSPELELLLHFERVYPDKKKQQLATNSIKDSQLTPIEYTVLMHIALGNSNKEIAQIQKN